MEEFLASCAVVDSCQAEIEDPFQLFFSSKYRAVCCDVQFGTKAH